MNGQKDMCQGDKRFQEEETPGAKALRQEQTRCIERIARKLRYLTRNWYLGERYKTRMSRLRWKDHSGHCNLRTTVVFEFKCDRKPLETLKK